MLRSTTGAVCERSASRPYNRVLFVRWFIDCSSLQIFKNSENSTHRRVSQVNLKQVWQQLDLDSTGRIDYAQFESALRRRRLLRRIVSAYVDSCNVATTSQLAFRVPTTFDYARPTHENYKDGAADLNKGAFFSSKFETRKNRECRVCVRGSTPLSSPELLRAYPISRVSRSVRATAREGRLELPRQAERRAPTLARRAVQGSIENSVRGAFREWVETGAQGEVAMESVLGVSLTALERVGTLDRVPESVTWKRTVVTRVENETQIEMMCVKGARAVSESSSLSRIFAKREEKTPPCLSCCGVQAVIESIAVRTEEQTRPWCVYTCGPMGAGKGHALGWLSEHGYFPLENLVHVDPDLFKQMMPEWRGYVERDVLETHLRVFSR